MLRLLLGDAATLLRELPDASVDALVTDPPAGIAFMGKAWDRNHGGRVAWAAVHAEILGECHRAMKPGAYGLVWALPRTSHWTACALEDAGFEIRDVVTHLQGQGFPKNKACLKPASEHWILCRRPAKRMTPLNVDACRIPVTEHLRAPQSDPHKRGQGAGEFCISTRDTAAMHAAQAASIERTNTLGRWPPNAIFTHDEDCGETCAPGCPVAKLDAQSGERRGMQRTVLARGKTTGRGIGLGSTAVGQIVVAGYGDTGGASRFFPCFYVPKASRGERNSGCADLPAKANRINAPRTSEAENFSASVNHHPTVKPIALMRWLCSLITPAGGVVLDPFMGSGTTGVAAVQEGLSFVGMEREPDYFAIAEARIKAAEPAQLKLGHSGPVA